mmetsp:Transcript_9819/g.23727  ORF Transcript_9819/g.23727 Transcript_9819/m.23727 type:complete len:118 (+) Transcript_9819:151-504(+)
MKPRNDWCILSSSGKRFYPGEPKIISDISPNRNSMDCSLDICCILEHPGSSSISYPKQPEFNHRKRLAGTAVRQSQTDCKFKVPTFVPSTTYVVLFNSCLHNPWLVVWVMCEFDVIK